MALSVAVHGCGNAEQQDASETSKFFENAFRRAPLVEEKKLVVKVPNCSGFWVENTAGKSYVMTARHCFNFAITDWCNKSGSFVSGDGIHGRCRRVVTGDLSRDMVMIEAAVSKRPSAQHTLRLAAYQPEVGTRLKMIGYPADRHRRGALTVTENCWILQKSVRSPFKNMNEQSSLHNCTTYGGNSGGPMIVEGTRDAVGMPFTFKRYDYRLRNSESLTTAAHMAQMADFVKMNRKNLKSAGVVIAEEPTPLAQQAGQN